MPKSSRKSTAKPAPVGSTTNAPSPWILIVDDEAPVLKLIETVLVVHGWQVKLADGAEAALALVDNAPTPPILLICDVVMPKMDGLALTRQLLAKVPELSVILISGKLADTAWWPADLGRIRLLKKPFQNDELVAAVREALLSHGSGS